MLLKQDNEQFNTMWPVLTPSLLLQPFADIIPFPKYFTILYQFLSELHIASSIVEKGYSNGLSNKRQAVEKVQVAAKWIPQILRNIQLEGKSVLLPYLIELLSNSDTALHASLLVLNKIMQYYGPKASKKSFLQPLMKMYDSDFTSTNAVLLFHRSFVSQLMVRFGLKVFLRYLLDFIVNATTGMKYCPKFDDADGRDQIGVMPETGRTRYLSDVQDAFDFFGKSGSFQGRSFMQQKAMENERADSPRLEITGVSDDEGDDDVLVDESNSNKEQSTTSGDSSSADAVSLNEDGRQRTDTEETLTKDTHLEESTGDLRLDISGNSEDSINRNEDQRTDNTDDANLLLQPSPAAPASPAATSSPRDVKGGQGSGAISNRSNQDVMEENNSPLPSAKVQFAQENQEMESLPLQAYVPSMDLTVSSLLDLPPGSTMVNVAVETIMWMAHRLGPALTATYLSSKLLRALAQCYVGREQLCNYDYDTDSESTDGKYIELQNHN